MDMSNRLVMLNAMVGGNEESSTLLVYLQVAGKAIMNKAYPFQNAARPADVPEQYHELQAEIAAYLMNKRGAEGQTRHDENGITRTYQNADIPDDMLKQVVSHVGTW